MKHKRLLLIFGCLAAVLLAGYGTLSLTEPRHRITLDNIGAIHKGITEKDVETILGAKAGDYSSNGTGGIFIEDDPTREGWPAIPGWESPKTISGLNLVSKRSGKLWVAEETSVWIRFDEAGLVADILPGCFVPQREESFLAKLRRWLGM